MSQIIDTPRIDIPEEIVQQLKTIVNLVEVREVTEVQRPVLDIFNTRRCNKLTQWFFYGTGYTGQEAKVRIPLSQYICMPNGDERLAGGPSFFIATPRAKEPYYLTYVDELIPVQVPLESTAGYWSQQPYDVFVEVYSWLPSGAPAPNVSFSWHCVVDYAKFSAL